MAPVIILFHYLQNIYIIKKKQILKYTVKAASGNLVNYKTSLHLYDD